MIELSTTRYIPVETPQLRRQARLGGIAESTLVIWAMSTTVYWLKLETCKQWYKVSPFKSVNRLVPSLGMQGEGLNGNVEHRLLFFDLQSLQSPQFAKNTGIT